MSNALEQWKQFETDQEEFRSERSNVSDGDDGSIAKRKFFHKFFILYSAITVINAILLAIGQILGMTIEELPREMSEGIRYGISIYLIFFCILAVMIEIECFQFIRQSKILMNWISRGLAYIFMALLSVDQASLGGTNSETELAFIKHVSYAFGVIGAGYFAMGCLCLQIWLGKLREGYDGRKNPEDFETMSMI
jgi:hypothetical protein